MQKTPTPVYTLLRPQFFDSLDQEKVSKASFFTKNQIKKVCAVVHLPDVKPPHRPFSLAGLRKLAAASYSPHPFTLGSGDVNLYSRNFLPHASKFPYRGIKFFYLLYIGSTSYQ